MARWMKRAAKWPGLLLGGTGVPPSMHDRQLDHGICGDDWLRVCRPNGAKPIRADDRYRGSRWRMRGSSKRPVKAGGRGRATECLPPNHSPWFPSWPSFGLHRPPVGQPLSANPAKRSLQRAAPSQSMRRTRICESRVLRGCGRQVPATAMGADWTRRRTRVKARGSMAGSAGDARPLCRHASPFSRKLLYSAPAPHLADVPCVLYLIIQGLFVSCHCGRVD